MRKTLIIAFVFLAATLQAAMPRLTVVVVVDGLHQENMDLLRPYWPQGGLRTLSEEAFQTTISFPHLVYGGNESVATLLTGTVPARHGIAGNTYFRRSDRRIRPILEDVNVSGIGTNEQFSPRALLATSMADEVRIQYGERSKIYAIGLHGETTVLMAGHGANGCCWLNPSTQQWVTTSYYESYLPAEALEMNGSGRIAEVAGQSWTPRLDVSSYNRPTDKEKKKGFSYSVADHLLKTPMSNTLVVELALAMQKSENMGTDLVPDLLLLEMTTTTPQANGDIIQTAEQEDAYLSLNQDLGYLMDQLMKRIGKSNLQIMVVGKPELGHSADILQRARISVSQFNVDRAAALTGAYLMALYGSERWVDGGYGNSIYLNRTLIEQRHLSLETMQRQVANFLLEFEGVESAFPVYESVGSPIASSLTKKTSGDVVFTLQDNWILTAGENRILDYVIDANPTVPLLLWSGSYRSFPTAKTTMQATEVLPLLLQ